jgi:transcriptional regulator with XRE-family HTH domain
MNSPRYDCAARNGPGQIEGKRMITGEQLRAARAMLRWEQAELAARAKVSADTIKRFEASEGELRGRSDTIRSITKELEYAGIEFLNSDDERYEPSRKHRGGTGVRFAVDRSQKYRNLIASEIWGLTSVILWQEYTKDAKFFDKQPEQIADVLFKQLVPLVQKTLGSTLKHKTDAQARHLGDAPISTAT